MPYMKATKDSEPQHAAAFNIDSYVEVFYL